MRIRTSSAGARRRWSLLGSRASLAVVALAAAAAWPFAACDPPAGDALLAGAARDAGAATASPSAESRCGDRPELPYACAGGQFPCTCVDVPGAASKWECGACPPVDCKATPNDPSCQGSVSCVVCHGLASSAGGAGIENAHPWSPLSCVTCHGGKGSDPSDPTRPLGKDEAHVPMPAAIAQPGSCSQPSRDAYASAYLGRAGVEKLAGGPEWIRFMNPGDLRIVEATCAQAACHAGAGEKVRRSTMSTLVGKYDAMLELAGVERDPAIAKRIDQAVGAGSYAKHLATYGALSVDNPQFDPATAPPGAVPALTALVSVDREHDKPFGTYTETDLLTETMNKLCGNCHLNNNGANDKYGYFRSSGCTACHMPYAFSGQSESGDPNVPKGEPRYPAAYEQIQYPERPHPVRHQLQRTMTAADCLPCHTGSNRTVLQYWGIRTDDNRDLTRARAAGSDVRFRYATLIDGTHDPAARLHGFTQDQLIEYEDLNDDGQDDTPPDLHHEAGLECIDCHTATEMHGDGNIVSRQNQATQIRCVHCHGNLEFPADPDAPTNPINQLYRASNKTTRKYLWRFDAAPAYGQDGYPFVKSAGIWLRTKARGEWKYVPQIRWGAEWDPAAQDCTGDGRRIDPRTGAFVCDPSASIAHGRWQGLDAAAGDLLDGTGPRPGVEVAVGADGASTAVTAGFSHLGAPATAPNENPTGGLECAACHATWHNMRYGNHLGLVDTDGTNRLYDWDRVTGRTTIGKQGWFDFTFVDMLDLQLGVDAKGKISQFTPTRLKMFVRASVLDPSRDAPVDFMSLVGDPDRPWRTYRDRVGRGNLVQGAANGVRNAPGWKPICLEPGYCDGDPAKNENGALGVDQMEPHAIQRRPRDCDGCHLDASGGGMPRVSAVFGWNPRGYTKETSPYLAKVRQVVTPHGTYSTDAGLVIADDGISHRLDWLVDEATGYPLASTLHVRTDGGKGIPTYDPATAGPITKPLIEEIKRIRVRRLYP